MIIFLFAVLISFAAVSPQPDSVSEQRENEKHYGLPKDPMKTKLQACCACHHYMQEDIRDCVTTRKALISAAAAFQSTSSKQRPEDARARHIGRLINRGSHWGDLSGLFRRLNGAADKDELPPVLFKDGITRERKDQLQHDCYNSMKCTVGRCPSARKESASFRSLDRSGYGDAEKFCWAPLPFISRVIWGQDCSDLEVYPQCNQLREDRWHGLQAELQKEGDAHEADEYDVPLCCLVRTCDPVKNKCPAATKPGAASELAGVYRVPPTPAPLTPKPTDAPVFPRQQQPVIKDDRVEAEAQQKLAAFDLRNKRRFEEKRKKKKARVAAHARLLESQRAADAARKTAYALALQQFNRRSVKWSKDKATWSNHQWTMYCKFNDSDEDCAAQDDDGVGTTASTQQAVGQREKPAGHAPPPTHKKGPAVHKHIEEDGGGVVGGEMASRAKAKAKAKAKARSGTIPGTPRSGSGSSTPRSKISSSRYDDDDV